MMNAMLSLESAIPRRYLKPAGKLVDGLAKLFYLGPPTASAKLAGEVELEGGTESEEVPRVRQPLSIHLALYLIRPPLLPPCIPSRWHWLFWANYWSLLRCCDPPCWSQENVDLWREMVAAATNPSQAFVYFNILNDSVVWKKSILKTRCKLCKKSGDAEKMLLCDKCDGMSQWWCSREVAAGFVCASLSEPTDLLMASPTFGIDC